MRGLSLETTATDEIPLLRILSTEMEVKRLGNLLREMAIQDMYNGPSPPLPIDLQV
jgi:hypothetical protein